MAHTSIDFIVSVPLQKVWDFLSNMEEVARCIQGVQGVEKISETEYIWKMKVKVGFISREMTLRTIAVEQKPPTHGAFQGEGDEISIKGIIDLEKIKEDETKVVYSADVEAKGQLKGIINQVVNMQMKDQSMLFAECVRSKLQPTK